MSANATSSTATSLTRLLDQLRALYERLLALIEEKMGAMRRADLHTLRALHEEEASLVHRLQEREGLRRQLMRLLGQELGWSDGAGRSATIPQLAEGVGGGQRDELMVAAADLREVVARTARANRVAAIATRDVLHHMQWVLPSIRPGGRQPAGYSAKGGTVDANGALLFETLG